MLVRVFYKDFCKDFPLDSQSRFTIGSGAKDNFCISDADLKKGHVVLYSHKGEWEIACNGEVFLRGASLKREPLQMCGTYVLSQKHRISMICLDDSAIQVKSFELGEVQEVTIGRSTDNQIVLPSSLVSSHHAKIRKIGSIYYIRDLGSTNGTYLNEKRISESKLSASDCIIIGPFQIVFHGISLEVLCMGGNAAQIYSAKKIHQLLSEDVEFVRSPRLKLDVPLGEIEIESPPAVTVKPELNLVSMLLPALGTVGVAVVMTAISGIPMMLLYTLPMTFIGLIVSGMNYRKQKKGYSNQIDVRVEKYNEHLNQAVITIKQWQKQQIDALIAADPDINDCFHMAETVDRKLWGRKPTDADFMSVRVGTGKLPSSFDIRVPKEGISLEDDELRRRPKEIYQKYCMVNYVPITCSILENQVCGIVGSTKDTAHLINNTVTQIATHHCYTEVRTIFVYDQKDQAEFSWIEKLPHTLGDDRTVHLVATSRREAERLFNSAAEVMKARKLEMEDADNFGTVPMPLPYYLFIIAQPAFLGRNDSITEYLFKNKKYNAGVLLAVESLMQLPKECNLIIEVSNQQGKMYHRENASFIQRFVVDNGDTKGFAAFANNLSHIICNEEIAQSVIPKNYSFFEMMKLKSADQIDLDQLWASSDVTKSLAVPLGIGDGKEIFLDLHEKAHGPHGLVAGTTGSGKSELLQSYILSVAVHFHPYEVGFVIIDFKGGGMANQFEKLPHLVGTVTNIDGKAIERSLLSIKAELTKRQRLFAEQNVNSIDKYIEKYKKGEVENPLPHLIIVVDEFAELKAEQPEFMKELVSAARIGRSLGIHLILATQKPAGQVSDQIWSNSRFKICLKVSTREDSNEVIKSTAAFNIKEPGRAYLQVGNNEVFELFQSGYSGGKVYLGERVCTQLDAVVNHICTYCEDHGIWKLPDICMPALGEVIPYPARSMYSEKGVQALVGLYDAPTIQSQGDVVLNLSNENVMIIGSPQYGKTNILQTILRCGCENYSSNRLNFYIVDFASMILKNFERSDHVGGVVLSNEDEKMENLFKMLLSEISRRKELFASKGISSYSAYLEAGFELLPQIVLLIDNMTAMLELYPKESESLLLISREGISVGIGIVVANAQTSGIGFKYLLNFSRRIALYCNDTGEYSTLFDRSRLAVDCVPGRALLEIDHQMVEAQMFLGFDGAREIERVEAIRDFISNSNSNNSGIPAPEIPVVPELVTMDGLKESGYDVAVKEYRIPLGVDYATMQLLHLDIMKNGVLVITGAEKSGKTNLTMHILNSIQSNIFDNLSQIYIADDTQGLRPAGEYGCVQQYVNELSEAKAMIEGVYGEIQHRKEIWSADVALEIPMLVLVLSGQDLIMSILQDNKMAEKLMALAKDMRKYKVFLLLSDVENGAINYASPALLKHVKETHSVIALDNIQDIRLIEVPMKFHKEFAKEIRIGDGYSFLSGKVRKIHFVLNQDM